jgi:hypothetical protein
MWRGATSSLCRPRRLAALAFCETSIGCDRPALVRTSSPATPTVSGRLRRERRRSHGGTEPTEGRTEKRRQGLPVAYSVLAPRVARRRERTGAKSRALSDRRSVRGFAPARGGRASTLNATDHPYLSVHPRWLPCSVCERLRSLRPLRRRPRYWMIPPKALYTATTAVKLLDSACATASSAWSCVRSASSSARKSATPSR